MSPSPDDNRDSICFWNSILLLERRKIGLSHSISAFESVKPLSKSASKYDFNSFQLVLFRVQKRTRYIILIPCTRIILENTFIQENVKLSARISVANASRRRLQRMKSRDGKDRLRNRLAFDRRRSIFSQIPEPRMVYIILVLLNV